MAEPFYKRSLDSFDDWIITEVHQADNGLWYAKLDRGGNVYISTDFSTCASTAELAVSQCAAKIRADQRGEGKFAPHACMEGYDFRFKLCAWWDQKELLVARALATHPPRPADNAAAAQGGEVQS